MFGGGGDDIYLFGRGDGYDRLGEKPNASGTPSNDVLRLGAGVLPEHVTLYRDQDGLGGEDLIVVIDESSTQVYMDSYFLAGDYKIERIEFDGGAGAVWTAEDINARVQAGTQNAMVGTAADDTFYVDHWMDSITEAANAGIDTVYASRAYTLPNNVENLTLTGPLNINAIGNSLNNILRGNGSDNVLMGYGGYDVAYGGRGNDTYRDVELVVELQDEGIDTWVTGEGGTLPDNVENMSLNDGSGSHSIYSVWATGNALDNVLTSSGIGFTGDYLDGRGGADTMIILGNDKPTVFIDNPGDRVVGAAYEIRSSIDYVLPEPSRYAAGGYITDSVTNRLVLLGSDAISGTGNANSNVLDGSQNAAANTLIGGMGDDTYIIGMNDRVVEAAGEGFDQIRFVTSYSNPSRDIRIADFGLVNIERYILQSAGYTLWGDEQDNDLSIQLNSYSSLGASLSGGGGRDTLYGGTGDDFLDGGSGADQMWGGTGRDTYVVDHADDVVTEYYSLYSSDWDTIQSSVTRTLDPNVENLTLTGSAVINGTGNELANVLRGNSASNTLDGLDGNDTIYAGDSDSAHGGNGNDTLISENAGSWSYLWGEAGDDVLVGGSYSGFFAGGLGNDTITGSAGLNFIWGDDQFANGLGGNDVITGGDNYDYVMAGGGDDLVYGNGGGDYLSGNQGNDALYGGVGNDTLSGGQGVDTLVGGTGDDTYGVDNVADIVTENAGEGTDTVQASIAYTLGANLENLTLMNSSAINGTGNELNNVLTGNSANNTLTGGAGDDILKGGTTGTPVSASLSSLVIYARGTSVLDIYPAMQVYVDGVLIQEFTADAASYTAYTVDPAKLGMAAGKVDVVFTNDAWRPDISQDRNLYVQKIEVNGQILNATDNGVFYDPGSGAAAFDGINLRLGQETLASNGALRFALGDNDTLDGGSGADQMSGGSGNDTYLVDNTGDVLTEMANEGMDTVRSSISHALGANLENLVLTGTAAINGTGNELNNLLMGNTGNNILTGGVGVDTLIGNAGNDRLDGGAGNDILQGGQGNDTYVVESAGDSVSESANQGSDTVESSIGHTLGANVENLTLTGAAAINGTGNELDNYLMGNSANNVLTGGAGNDSLDGGAGADIMVGGVGNDYYVIDNVGDIVTENAGEGTADSVELYLNADYTLGANIEYFYRYGSGNWTTTGNAADNYLYGGSGNDTLIGLAGNDLLWGDLGADTLIGGMGNDRYYVDNAGDVVTENASEGVDTVYVWSLPTYTLAANVENGSRMFWAGNLTGNELDNSLSGSWGVDTLDGGAGADTLNSGAGNDTLVGGTGNDTYIMNRGYGIDTMVENDATAGNTDIAQFLAGVSADQIWFQHVGNNLEASIIGTTDKLVISDWYLGSEHQVEQFKTTDGAKTLLDSNVQNLVNAMASFAPPAAGQTTLPTNYQTSLAPVIAANWQ